LPISKVVPPDHTKFHWVTNSGFHIIKTDLRFIKKHRMLLPMSNKPPSTDRERQQTQHPLFSLSPEELDFVLRLVLASGSLKELAQAYQVSYPTIRVRVDRLIARLQKLIEGLPTDPMNELLAELVERGEMTYSAAVAIRDLYRKQKEKGDSS
jgi:hypothetical protein